jgi:hypothetical protein
VRSRTVDPDPDPDPDPDAAGGSEEKRFIRRDETPGR